jgi:hypothetical protein
MSPEFRGLSLQSRRFASSSLARLEVAPFSTRSLWLSGEKWRSRAAEDLEHRLLSSDLPHV